jgi:hypothetical protein
MAATALTLGRNLAQLILIHNPPKINRKPINLQINFNY